MNGILVFALFVAVIIIIVMASKAKAKSQSVKDAERLKEIDEDFRRLKEQSQQRGNEWVNISRRLPIVDPMRTPSLHSPIYDCVSDDFELPCRHDTFPYQSSSNVHRIGMNSTAEVEKFLTGIVGNPETSALVEFPDSLIVMRTNTLAEPGASIWQLWHISDERWFIYWWRSGMRPSAKAIDPPFWVRDISANPLKWLKREESRQKELYSNSNFQYELKLCQHLAAIITFCLLVHSLSLFV